MDGENLTAGREKPPGLGTQPRTPESPRGWRVTEATHPSAVRKLWAQRPSPAYPGLSGRTLHEERGPGRCVEGLLGTWAHEEALQVREEYRDLRAQQEAVSPAGGWSRRRSSTTTALQSGAAAAGGCRRPTPLTCRCC